MPQRQIDKAAIAREEGGVPIEERRRIAFELGATEVQAPTTPAAAPPEDAGLLRGIWNSVNPLPALRALYEEGPVGMFEGAAQAQADEFQKAKAAFDRGDYQEAAIHTAYWMLPVFGPALSGARDKMTGGQVREGLGETIGLGAGAAMSMRTPAPPKPSARLQNVAESLYGDALKGGLKSRAKTPPAELRDLARTGLESGIVVSEKGAHKLGALIADLDKKVNAAEGAAASRGLGVNKFSVASRLSQTADLFRKQATPKTDLAEISAAGNEFLAAHPGVMAADYAGDIKRGTYQAHRKQYTGERKGARIEAEKALARGIKEELQTLIPELGDLLPHESKLREFDEVLEKAVNQAAHGRSGWFKDMATGAAGGVLTNSRSVAVATGVVRSVLSQPNVKSKLALAIYRAQYMRPKKYGIASKARAAARVDSILAALGASLPDQSDPGID